MLKQDIGRSIKSERIRQGLTIEQLAVKMDTSTTTIYRYEQGRHSFTTSTLEKIARALDCTVEVIIRPTTP